MKNFLRKLLRIDNGKDQAVNVLRENILKEKKKDLLELKKINRKLRLTLEEGDVEITIKNVKGVLDELK